MTEDKEETAVYRHLRRGFDSLGGGGGGSDQATAPLANSSAEGSSSSDEKEWPGHRRVLVHFLDPGHVTSISSRGAPSSPQKNDASQQAQSRLSLNERFAAIFETVHHNRLLSVSYQDARSKADNTIPYVNVQCRFLESQVDLLQTHEEDIASDDFSTNAWHTRPYCYVYFVTGCQTMDEYRTKAKPSIQVFLSQLDDLYQKQAMQLSAGSDDASPCYLLVYCPSRLPGTAPLLPGHDEAPGHHHHGSGGAAGQHRGLTFADRFRQRMGRDSGDASTEAAVVAAPDTTETSGSSSDHMTPVAESFNPLSVLTKVEKEVARRLAMDFPQGTVATCTTLGNDYQATVAKNHPGLKPALDELERNEWQALLTSLSRTVVHGFDNLSNRLLKALRKISNTQEKDNKDVGHYFLLKESLAFTYQQMNLPAEACLQYDELRVFLPDLQVMRQFQNPHEKDGDDLLQGISGGEMIERRKKTVLPQPAVPIWKSTAMEQSTSQFRRSIQGLHYDEYYRKAAAMEFYLWERETALLFELGDVMQVMHKTFRFVTGLWEYHKGILPEPSGNDDDEVAAYREYMTALDEWAFCFCWDVQRASQQHVLRLERQHGGSSSGSIRSGGSITTMSAGGNARDQAFGRYLCDIVAYGYARLLALAQSKQIRTKSQQSFPDLAKPWESWTPPTKEEIQSATPPASVESFNKMSGKMFIAKANENAPEFVSQYMVVLQIYIAACAFCGRNRSAARMTMELVDLQVERGRIADAAQALQAAGRVYARDGWSTCHFMVHFRLAGFRRTLKLSPRDYLATLVQCFGRHTTSVHLVVPPPPAALDLLCRDFEAVMDALAKEQQQQEDPPKTSEAVVKAASFFNCPIFEAVFRMSDGKKRRLPSQRKLPRKVFSVGDTVKLSVGVISHLPKEIEGVTVAASLVPHRSYVAAQKQKRTVESSEICHTISTPEQIVLRPGENELELNWTPTFSGQFVLSQVAVIYKGTNFVNTHERMKELGFWMDVLPVEPSQTMHVKPLFLVPGREQQLTIEFHSGDDHVESGELNLVCSPGLVLLPPAEQEREEAKQGEGKWLSNWQCPVKESPRGETQIFTVSVTGVMGQSFDESEATVVPTIHVKITTTFRCGATAAASPTEVGSSHFQHEMESVIPALGDSALSVESMSLNPYSEGRVILGVSARCHVPAPFVLKNWDLSLPPHLKMVESQSDHMNKSSADTTLVNGETVSFAFDCSASGAVPQAGAVTEQPALVTELRDEYNSKFQEELLLRIKKSMALPATSLPGEVHSMVIHAETSNKEGMVGIPTQLAYTLDTTPFTDWNGRILYTLDTNNPAWLVMGNTKGVVRSGAGLAEWKLTVSAIPTCPGSVTKLPAVELQFEGGGLEQPFPILLPFASQDAPFTSKLQQKHSTVAFPAKN